ncbi:hypothetical protein AAFF_G00001210 [Aldrovandia affinis]|uniref:Uncharacterized protein n=1 Tax=Aldrovandia affinis TaxID=143900 RepID=A0AAD7TCV1_9TELE|nr:hypothetical protein AAFF_G00001210 [Aldrovandia affinis]
MQGLAAARGLSDAVADAQRVTPVRRAARYSRLDCLRFLAGLGPGGPFRVRGGAKEETDCGALLAHYAMARGDLTCLKLLIQEAPG